MKARTFAVLLSRQFRALRASWAAWALVAASAFFAVTAPVTARWMPEILGGLLGGDDAVPIDVSALPEPVAADAWTQWSSNLSQLIIVIVVIVAAAAVSADVSRGTAVPVLARPGVSRAGLFASALVAVAATALSLAVTELLFDGSAVALTAEGTGLWLLFAASAIAVTMAASAAGATSLGAAATGIGYYAVMAFAGIWPAAAKWSPAGLLSAADGSAEAAAITVTVIVAAGAVAAGFASFGRREL